MENTYLKAVAAAIVVAVAVVAAYGANAYHQKRAQLREITALVADASAQLRTALEGKVDEADLAKADANLQTLRTMKTNRQHLVADEAEGYLIGVRTIVRARGDAERLTRAFAADGQALVAHMGTRRNDAWFARAMELKKRVELDHYDLSLAYKALDDVLFLLPEDGKRLTPHVGSAVLVEDTTAAEARKRFQAQHAAVNARLAEIRRLPDR